MNDNHLSCLAYSTVALHNLHWHLSNSLTHISVRLTLCHLLTSLKLADTHVSILYTMSPTDVSQTRWPTCQYTSHYVTYWHLSNSLTHMSVHLTLCHLMSLHVTYKQHRFHFWTTVKQIIHCDVFPTNYVTMYNNWYTNSVFLCNCKPEGRSQWPRDLRLRSAVVNLVGLRVRIPSGAWMLWVLWVVR